MISQPVQLATNVLGLRWGALSSAFILFSPCLMMLGMVGPFVIKTVTSGLERVGRTAGTVYAISTLGSVAGTLILGFYLLPIRSEEHTSELQSRGHLVCRLLLEKKNNIF